MVFTKYKSLVFYGLLVLTFLAALQTVAAYHGHQSFYDDPYYYADSGRYYRNMYTHHQYHVLAYRDHYSGYNQYYSYPPARYYRYNYYPRPRCQYPGDVCY